MNKSYKYRIYPTRRQRKLLQAQLDACRWLYNHFLAQRKAVYEATGKGISCYDQQVIIPALKEVHPALALVHSQVLQNVAVRLDLAFKAFFRRIREKAEKPGFPRFKAFWRYDSMTYPQVQTGGCVIVGDRLKVTKVGHIKIVLHRPIQGLPKTATITRSSTGKWYVCFSCENVQPQAEPETGKAVGLDVGLKSFATLSIGKVIENPRFFRKEEKALATAQRKKAKVQPRTKKIRKLARRVARIHERIKWRRDNFCHQHSRQIVRHFDLIAVEALNVKGMVQNHSLSKSISDAAWTAFRTMIACKAAEAGKHYIAINPAFTSQTCNNCGWRPPDKLTMSDRWFSCGQCGLSLDRDHNAALNILSLGLQALGQCTIEAPGL